jgi:hypothetical protein
VIDGQIDYSSYTRAQLFDALRHIDRARYPLNLANIERALAALPPPDPDVRVEAAILNAVAIRPKNRRARRWAAAIFVCVTVAVAATVGLYLAKAWSLTAKCFQASADFVKSSPEAQQWLGTPISANSINGRGDTVFAKEPVMHVTLDVKGPKGQGVITGDARRVGDQWTFENFRLRIEGQKEPIELSAKETK